MTRERSIGRLRAGQAAAPAPAPAWSPADITYTTGMWLRPRDLSTGFQDTSATSPITTAGQFLARLNDKSGNANNVIQATGSAQAEYSVVSTIPSYYLDGIDDGLGKASITLGSDMDCFVAFKRSSTASSKPIFAGVTDTPGIGIWTNGNAARPDLNAGTPTYTVDGVSVTATRGALHTAMTVGAWHIMAILNANLSTWTAFGLGNWTGAAGFVTAADFGGMVLCPAQDATTRGKILTYLGSDVGLTL